MDLRILTSAKAHGISGGLTYESSSALQPGTIVTIPLRNTSLEGIVLGEAEIGRTFDVKSIQSELYPEPLLSPEHMKTMEWIAAYYSCSLRQAIRPFLPGKPWADLLPQEILYYQKIGNVEVQGKKQQNVLDALASGNSMSWDTLRNDTGATKATMKSLVDKGAIVEKIDKEFSSYSSEYIIVKRPTLSPHQKNAYQRIRESSIPSLLFGVTGSGKTEIYMQLIADAIETGKQAMVLVPEIFLTEHSIPRYTGMMDQKHIAILHSRLTPAQKRETWKQIRFGDIKLIIGSRSALFAPAHKLGLIIIDEEHEWTYKNEQSPRYHAREVAEQLCENFNARLVLGTATPSLESWYKAKNGAYTLAELSERYGDALMPHVTVIDLSTVNFANHYPFSNTLFDAIEERLSQKEQVVLFLNRRGMATSIMCLDCKRRLISPESNLPFTVHRTTQNQYYLQDHTSGATARIPEVCPGCQSTRLHSVGAGTQGIEDTLHKRFPSARILRADSDTLTSPDEMRSLLHKMENGEADILLGTQSVVKGLDLPRVTLAAVLIADVGMSLPHFRAGERTFQLLTQLTGRSGRKTSGEVILQTFRPDCPEVKLSALHKTSEYLDYELTTREKMLYPPYSTMLRLIFRNSDQKHRAESLTAELRSSFEHLRIGCSPTFFGGGKEWHILVRGKNPQQILSSIDLTDIVVDIDPLDCV
ncbi:primosomal protein N' [Candidatus Peregrinibacteria bacterium CG10_big_fil_rev_8_21_14_0_10_42_8]|nr:MAG: primosomal protein N' [Candidatus Peregrinibacteria bacterium CG10_big_fil_rev_8_21_14_0_10_42_8]